MSTGGGRYPLEAARTLRDDAVEVARQALSTAMRELEALEHQRDRATELVLERTRRIEHERVAEAEKDASGRSAAHMLAGQAWIRRLETEREQARVAERAAQADVRAGEGAVESKRAALAQARAEAKAVEHHHERWTRDRKRAALAKEEAEAEEHAGRKHHDRG